MCAHLKANLGGKVVTSVTPAAAVLSTVLGLVVLAEWAAESLQIARVQIQFVPMAPATALCFAFLGLVLLCHRRGSTNQVLRVAMPLMAGFVLIFSAILFIQFVSEWRLDIERWIAPETTFSQGVAVGRMSPLTSVLFVLLSLATWPPFPRLSDARSRNLVSQGLALLVFGVAAVLAIGYWFGTPLLYGGKLIPVALPTAIGFILLGVGLLFDGPDSLLFRLAVSDSVFARFTRMAVPGSIAIILVGGWFTLTVISRADAPYRVVSVGVTAVLTAALVAFLMSAVARHVQAAVSSADSALRESEQKYRSLVTNIPDIVWTTDSYGNTTFVSSNVESILGFTSEELCENGRNSWLSRIDPEDAEKVKKAFDALFKDRLPFEIEYRVRRKDGTLIWLRDRALAPYEKDGVCFADGISSDVTKRKLAELALGDNLQFVQNLMQAIPNPVFYKGVDGRYWGCNPACEEFLGLPADSIVGKTVYDIAPPEVADEYRRRDQDLFNNPGVQIYEYKMIRADGAERNVVFYKSTFTDSFGKVAGLIAVVMDITEMRRAEAEREQYRNQLLQSQKMEAIGTLTGGIAHDFNNMLTVILGYSEMLLLDKKEGQAGYDDLQKIAQTALNGAELVKRLLVFSRQAEMKPVPLNLNHQIEQLKKLLSRTLPKMIDIVVDLVDQPALISADPSQMDQMMMYLALNSAEAMPEGGRLSIETKNVLLDEEYCRAHGEVKPGPYLMFGVSDTGQGMDQETLERIFEPFFTTKMRDSRKGTGLGLSVVRGIVEQHNGHVTCESQIGRGTTFRIYFSAIEPDEQPEDVAEHAPPLGRKETILLVDDEDLVRDLGQRILERSGYRVFTAANGKEALALYKKEQPNISLVILDLIMPEISGRQCLQEMQKLNPSVRVLVATGFSPDSLTREALEKATKGLVAKPYDMRQLLQSVRDALDAE
ncbi:MAG: PAS domain S-box protein [Desulfomonile tiedjei]|nr:PAS domain S-box protein [Desulfomonile tiedjei]